MGQDLWNKTRIIESLCNNDGKKNETNSETSFLLVYLPTCNNKFFAPVDGYIGLLIC